MERGTLVCRHVTSCSPPLAYARSSGTVVKVGLRSSFHDGGGTLLKKQSMVKLRAGLVQTGIVASTTPGAPSLTETGVPEQLKKSLQDVTVLDPSGRSVPLESLWKDRTAVVGLARHFGCVLCRKRADLLASRKAELDAAGVALILIGPGKPEQAKSFLQQTNFPGEVYADPSRSTYDAFQFVYGVFTTFTPKAGLSIINAYREGYRQDWELSFDTETRNTGGWQNGGVVVIGPGTDRLVFLHKDKEAGDEPDINEVLKACCSI